jgi:hypothetical protein
MLSGDSLSKIWAPLKTRDFNGQASPQFFKPGNVVELGIEGPGQQQTTSKRRSPRGGNTWLSL